MFPASVVVLGKRPRMTNIENIRIISLPTPHVQLLTQKRFHQTRLWASPTADTFRAREPQEAAKSVASRVML